MNLSIALTRNSKPCSNYKGPDIRCPSQVSSTSELLETIIRHLPSKTQGTDWGLGFRLKVFREATTEMSVHVPWKQRALSHGNRANSRAPTLKAVVNRLARNCHCQAPNSSAHHCFDALRRKFSAQCIDPQRILNERVYFG